MLRLPYPPLRTPARAVLVVPYHRKLDAVCDADAGSVANPDSYAGADAHGGTYPYAGPHGGAHT
jgi:hypothetical protein